MQKKLDKETEKIFTKGEHLKAMTESAGWAIAKEMLLRRVAGELNVANIGELNPQTIVTILGIKQETAKALIAWLKEIEGTVEQHKSNVDSFADVTDEYIINIEDLQHE